MRHTSLVADQAQVVPADLLPRLKALLDGPTSEEATAFATAALRSLQALPPEVCDENVIECLIVIAHFLFLANSSAAGLQAAASAVAHARDLQDKRSLRKALNVLGVMTTDMDDLPSAIEAHSEAIQIAREIGESELEAPGWNNLGVVLMNSAQYRDAINCFERAAALAKGSIDQCYVPGLAYGNIAFCSSQLGDIEIGIRAAREALELNPEPITPNDRFSRVLAECQFARLLVEVGEISRAEEHWEVALRLNSKAPTARAEYAVSITRGLIEVAAERVEAGLIRLKSTLEDVRKSVPSEMRDALSICIAAHETAGQPDVALVYLHELLALNRNTRAEQLLMQQQLLTAGISLSGQALDESVLISDASRLQSQVDARLQHLTNTAINAGLAAGHDLYRVFRVSRLAELFAQSEDWSADRVREVALAAKLADIGMIAAPEPLLTKTRGLSAAERKLMDDHTRFGAELLSGAKLALLQLCIPVARFHHEKWDGSGAWALAGEAIPLEARLVALCDAFDAMTHPRPWRPQPLSTAAALREIADQAGRQFDPELTARFVDFVQREFWKHDDFSAFLGEEALGNEYVRARLQITRMMAGEAEAR
jgi:putative two-component system response regulator